MRGTDARTIRAAADCRRPHGRPAPGQPAVTAVTALAAEATRGTAAGAFGCRAAATDRARLSQKQRSRPYWLTSRTGSKASSSGGGGDGGGSGIAPSDPAGRPAPWCTPHARASVTTTTVVVVMGRRRSGLMTAAAAAAPAPAYSSRTVLVVLLSLLLSALLPPQTAEAHSRLVCPPPRSSSATIKLVRVRHRPAVVRAPATLADGAAHLLVAHRVHAVRRRSGTSPSPLSTLIPARSPSTFRKSSPIQGRRFASTCRRRTMTPRHAHWPRPPRRRRCRLPGIGVSRSASGRNAARRASCWITFRTTQTALRALMRPCRTTTTSLPS